MEKGGRLMELELIAKMNVIATASIQYHMHVMWPN